MRKEVEAARDQEIVELIHKNTLRILEEIGIAFLSESALDLLRKNGVRVEGNRAYFTEKQVMDALDAAVKDFTVYARNAKYNVSMNTEDLYMTPGYGSPSVCEADGTLRPATFDDFLKLAVIVQESEEFAINGGILAQPCDIDAGISAEAMVYATLCRSDKALFSVCGGGEQAGGLKAPLAGFCLGMNFFHGNLLYSGWGIGGISAQFHVLRRIAVQQVRNVTLHGETPPLSKCLSASSGPAGAWFLWWTH